MSNFIVTTETAVVYKLRARKVDGRPVSFGWADAAVRAWPGGVSLSIQSDFGNYAYTWGAIGPGPWQTFLVKLDFDYFMGKTRSGYREFDRDKTFESIERQIIDHRRQGWGDLTKETARECWNDLELYAPDEFVSADQFLSEILRSAALSKFFGGDYGDLIQTSPSRQSVGFWKELWPSLCDAWRRELPVLEEAAA